MCLPGVEDSTLMALSLGGAGGLAWGGITEVSFLDEWVAGEGKTQAFQTQRAACSGNEG